MRRALHARAALGDWGVTTALPPLRTVTINMASTCDPRGASSAACPRAWLPAQPEAFPGVVLVPVPVAAVPPLPVPL